MAIRNGSIEILSDNGQTSEGIVVQTTDPSQLPGALKTIRGLEAFTTVDPPREGVDLEWSARTHDGFDVVVLWRETHPIGPVLG